MQRRVPFRASSNRDANCLHGALDALRHAAVTFLQEGIHLNLLGFLKCFFGGGTGSRFERLFGQALELEFQ